MIASRIIAISSLAFALSLGASAAKPQAGASTKKPFHEMPYEALRNELFFTYYHGESCLPKGWYKNDKHQIEITYYTHRLTQQSQLVAAAEKNNQLLAEQNKLMAALLQQNAVPHQAHAATPNTTTQPPENAQQSKPSDHKSNK